MTLGRCPLSILYFVINDSGQVSLELGDEVDMQKVLDEERPFLPPSLPHSLTPSLPHPLTPSLPHSLTPSLPHSITPSLTHSLTHSLPHSRADAGGRG